jgi:hypothetical protein
MSHFLLRYDRRRGILESMERFTDSAEATSRRFEMELVYLGQPSIEVVVLSAASEDDLRRTHSRFFRSLQQLTDQLGNQLTSVRVAGQP